MVLQLKYRCKNTEVILGIHISIHELTVRKEFENNLKKQQKLIVLIACNSTAEIAEHGISFIKKKNL